MFDLFPGTHAKVTKSLSPNFPSFLVGEHVLLKSPMSVLLRVS